MGLNSLKIKYVWEYFRRFDYSVRKNREIWGPLQNTGLYQKVLAFVEIYCWRFIDLWDKYWPSQSQGYYLSSGIINLSVFSDTKSICTLLHKVQMKSFIETSVNLSIMTTMVALQILLLKKEWYRGLVGRSTVHYYAGSQVAPFLVWGNTGWLHGC